jgi:VanZ family protein
MKLMIKYHGLTILWALFVLVICNINMGGVGHSSLFFPGFDKLTHCGLFFVLVVFYSNGHIRQQNRQRLTYKAALIITLFCIVFGGVIELLQLYVFTWRGAEWADLFADSVGACMATFSILITQHAVKHEK